ncbi:hypothetical protein AB0D32_04840 [Micromonospora sp. NPDC048170]|uniref:hypothetical protein n=1 Tax=Micromonospora sp. NPDC048170 TaxID=3154819 RepID=UPI0033DCB637
MLKLFSRRRNTHVRDVMLCESCGQVCTADCHAGARYERTRTTALTSYHIR